MLVKFIDEYSVDVFKNYYIDKETVYTNTEAQQLAIQNGYKELIIEEEPQYNNETEYIMEHFEETDKSVIKTWEIKERNPELDG